MNKFLASAALASLLAGCVNPPNSPTACQTWDQQYGLPQLSGVSVLSPDLTRVIGVHENTMSRTATGMAAVQTNVHNCSDADIVLIMRTRFSGDRGQTEPPSAWRTVHLPPRGATVYTESAISTASHKVQVDIHDANRGQQQFAPGQPYTPTQR